MIRPLSIAYVFNTGRKGRLEAVRSGDSPREFFLGALELEARGNRVNMIEVDLAKAPGIIGGIVNLMLQCGWMPEKMDGAAVEGVYRILPELNQHDVIVGTTSGIGFALAFYRRLGRLHPPVVAIHCGLLNNPYGPIRHRLTYFLLTCVYTVLYGEGEFAPIQRLFPSVKSRMSINSFGVDTEFWCPDPAVPREGFVLSVGNDGRRDFGTLLKAANRISTPVRIITSRSLPDTLPTNVVVSRGSWHEQTLSDKALRDLYRRAACVVVPLIESCQPSGQSVALQAMACGCPVILTRTAGLWDVDMMRDLENVLFVPPGDSIELAKALQEVIEDKVDRHTLGLNGYKSVKRKATTAHFARGMEVVLQRCTGNKLSIYEAVNKM